MISDRALAALRCGAAVLHATSGVRLRLSHDGSPLYDVSHPPIPDVDHTVLPTCRFRVAVVRAHHQHLHGCDLAMRGLPHGVDPQISYGVGPADRVLPGGVLRLERNGLWLHVTAFTRDPALVDALDSDESQAWAIETLDDDDLDVTIVCVPTDIDDPLGSAAAIDHLGDLAARIAVAEIEAHLAEVVKSS